MIGWRKGACCRYQATDPFEQCHRLAGIPKRWHRRQADPVIGVFFWEWGNQVVPYHLAARCAIRSKRLRCVCRLLSSKAPLGLEPQATKGPEGSKQPRSRCVQYGWLALLCSQCVVSWRIPRRAFSFRARFLICHATKRRLHHGNQNRLT